jgi:hypothetical protein
MLGMAPRLARQTLNRTFLARQLLLKRADLPVPKALEHLVGMQAQSPQAPYVGLWSRLAGFNPDDLSRLLVERRAVRMVLMRSTIHLVTARDCLRLRLLVQPVSERSLGGNYGRQLAGMDLESLAKTGRELVEERPQTVSGLEPLLARRWPERDAHALAMGVRALVPLVQVPPRGLWRRSGPSAHTTAESWLGRPLAARPSVDRMFTRYLAAFGPASVKDAQTWSGLARLGEVAERLRPTLRTYRGENGVELFDISEGRLADPEIHAPPRFLPEYDNALLSHADRSRIASREHGRRVFTKGGLLVDGFLTGRWDVKRARGRATLNVELFRRLAKAERAAATDEGEHLLAFVADDLQTRDVLLR